MNSNQRSARLSTHSNKEGTTLLKESRLKSINFHKKQGPKTKSLEKEATILNERTLKKKLRDLRFDRGGVIDGYLPKLWRNLKLILEGKDFCEFDVNCEIPMFDKELEKEKILTDEDGNYGDLVLVFPNPDNVNSEDFEKIQNPIEFTKSVKIFNKAFEHESATKYERSDIADMFFDLYCSLFLSLEEDEKQRKVNRLMLRQKLNTELIAAPNDIKNSYEEENKYSDEENEPNKGNLNSNNDELDMESIMLRNLFRDKDHTIKLENFNESLETSKLVSNKSLGSHQLSLNIPRSLPKTSKELPMEMQSPTSPLKERKKRYLANKRENRKFLYELKKTAFDSLKKSKKKQMEIDLTCRKINEGGFLKEVPVDSQSWFRTSKNTSDFLTLIRQVILAKLTYEAGCKLRSFLSQNGEHIFTVVYMNEDNMKIVAEQDKFNKRVFLGLSDLFSLEPVDKSFRPLRFNTKLWQPDDSGLTPYFAYVRPLLRKLLEEIDFRKLGRSINLLTSNQSVGILDENVISDEEWRAYHLYLTYLRDEIKNIRNLLQEKDNQKNENEFKVLTQGLGLCTKISSETVDKKKEEKKKRKLPKSSTINLKIKKRIDSNKLALKYFEAFKKGIQIVNYKNKKPILQNLWTMLGLEELEAHSDYYNINRNSNFKIKLRIISLWRRYLVTDLTKESLFSKMERLKLSYSLVSKFVNLNFLLENGFLTNWFVLHDPRELTGQDTKNWFKIPENNTEDAGNANKNITPQRKSRYQPLRKLGDVNLNSQENEETDPLKTEVEEAPKVPKESLAESWKFRITCPWFIPVESIRNYYGEKIALYFCFLGHYTKSLLGLGMFSAGFQAYQFFLTDNDKLIYLILLMIFSFMITLWGQLFIIRWKKKEYIFATKYGQHDFEQDELERASFSGVYQRSLENDQLNVVYYSHRKRNMKKITGFAVSIVILGLDMGIIFALFYLTDYLMSKRVLGDFAIVRFEFVVPAIMTYVIIHIFNLAFDKVAAVFTAYENHKTFSGFEKSYISKKFIFSMMNLIFPFFLISAIFSVFIPDRCGSTCIEELRTYLATIYAIILVLNVWEIAEPSFKLFIYNLKSKKVKESKKINEKKKPPSNKNRRKSRRNSLLQSFGNESSQKPNATGLFGEINEFIEREFNKEAYSPSVDLYGTVDDYNELIIQYALLSIFGMAFPLIFFLAFLINVLEIQTDKSKLIKFMQRPLPMGERTIGVWIPLMEFICTASILSNACLVSYTEEIINEDYKFFVFCFLIVGNFILKFIVNFIYGEVSLKLVYVFRRHQHICARIFQGISKADDNDTVKSTAPLLKIFGTRLPHGEFVSLGYEKNAEREKELIQMQNRRQELKSKYFKKYKWRPERPYQNPTVYIEKYNQTLSQRNFRLERKRRTTTKQKTNLKIGADKEKKTETSEDKLHLLNRSPEEKTRNKQSRKSKFQKQDVTSKKINKKHSLFFSEVMEESKSPKADKNFNMNKVQTHKNYSQVIRSFHLDINSDEFLGSNDLVQILSPFGEYLVNEKTATVENDTIRYYEEAMYTFTEKGSFLSKCELIELLHSKGGDETWLASNPNFSNDLLLVLKPARDFIDYAAYFRKKESIWRTSYLDTIFLKKTLCYELCSLRDIEDNDLDYDKNDREKFYIVRAFEGIDGKFVGDSDSSGYSLLSILTIRESHKLLYKEENLLQIMEELCLGLQEALNEASMNHGCLILKNINFSQSNYCYQIENFRKEVFFEDGSLKFLIEITHDLEFFFAPEILAQYKNTKPSQDPLQSNQFSETQMEKADVFSLGRIIIYLMIMGKTEKFDFNIKDIELILDKLQKFYPIVVSICRLLNYEAPEMRLTIDSLAELLSRERKERPEEETILQTYLPRTKQAAGKVAKEENVKESILTPDTFVRKYKIARCYLLFKNYERARDCFNKLNNEFKEVLTTLKTIPMEYLHCIWGEILAYFNDYKYTECWSLLVDLLDISNRLSGHEKFVWKIRVNELQTIILHRKKKLEEALKQTAKSWFFFKNFFSPDKYYLIRFYEIQGKIYSDSGLSHSAIYSFTCLIDIAEREARRKERAREKQLLISYAARGCYLLGRELFRLERYEQSLEKLKSGEKLYTENGMSYSIECFMIQSEIMKCLFKNCEVGDSMSYKLIIEEKLFLFSKFCLSIGARMFFWFDEFITFFKCFKFDVLSTVVIHIESCYELLSEEEITENCSVFREDGMDFKILSFLIIMARLLKMIDRTRSRNYLNFSRELISLLRDKYEKVQKLHEERKILLQWHMLKNSEWTLFIEFLFLSVENREIAEEKLESLIKDYQKIINKFWANDSLYNGIYSRRVGKFYVHAKLYKQAITELAVAYRMLVNDSKESKTQESKFQLIRCLQTQAFVYFLIKNMEEYQKCCEEAMNLLNQYKTVNTKLFLLSGLAMDFIILGGYDQARALLNTVIKNQHEDYLNGDYKRVDLENCIEEIVLFDLIILLGFCDFCLAQYSHFSRTLIRCIRVCKSKAKSLKNKANSENLDGAERFAFLFYSNNKRLSLLLSNLAKVCFYMGRYHNSFVFFSKALNKLSPEKLGLHKRPIEEAKVNLNTNGTKVGVKEKNLQGASFDHHMSIADLLKLKRAHKVEQESDLSPRKLLRMRKVGGNNLLKRIPTLSRSLSVHQSNFNRASTFLANESDEKADPETRIFKKTNTIMLNTSSNMTSSDRKNLKKENETSIQWLLMESENSISVKSILPILSHIARVQETIGYYPQALENYKKIIEIIDVLQDKIAEHDFLNSELEGKLDQKSKFYRDYFVIRFLSKIRLFRLYVVQGSIAECRELLNEMEMGLSMSYRKNVPYRPGANIDYYDSILMGIHLEIVKAEYSHALGELDNSLYLYKSILDKFQDILSEYDPCIIKYHEKIIQLSITQPNEPIQFKEKAITKQLKNATSLRPSLIRANIAIALFIESSNSTKADDYFKRASKVLLQFNEPSETGTRVLKSHLYITYAKFLIRQDRYQLAEEYLNGALAIYQNLVNRTQFCYLEMAEVLKEMGVMFINYPKIIKKNLEILEDIAKEPTNKITIWMKHYITIRFFENDRNMLSIFDEFRFSNTKFLLLNTLKETIKEEDIDLYSKKIVYDSSVYFFKAESNIEKALMIVKQILHPSNPKYEELEGLLVELKYARNSSQNPQKNN